MAGSALLLEDSHARDLHENDAREGVVVGLAQRGGEVGEHDREADVPDAVPPRVGAEHEPSVCSIRMSCVV